MATSAETRLFDRRLYLAAALLLPLVILIGFARTYYLKTVFGTPAVPSPLVHLHAVVMTAWVALFLVQVRLIASRRVRWHQQLGYASIVLAALIVVIGVPTALRAAKYGSPSTPPGVVPLAFLVVPAFDLLMFAMLFGAAIVYRRRPATHKRLMLLTAINFLPPALGRIAVPSLQALGPLWFFGVPVLVAAVCLVLDARRHGHVNRVFAGAIAMLVLSYVVRLAVMNTAPWMAFAGWVTQFV